MGLDDKKSTLWKNAMKNRLINDNYKKLFYE